MKLVEKWSGHLINVCYIVQINWYIIIVLRMHDSFCVEFAIYISIYVCVLAKSIQNIWCINWVGSSAKSFDYLFCTSGYTHRREIGSGKIRQTA